MYVLKVGSEYFLDFKGYRDGMRTSDNVNDVEHYGDYYFADVMRSHLQDVLRDMDDDSEVAIEVLPPDLVMARLGQKRLI